VQGTTRLGVSGAGAVAKYLQITADLGYNWVTNSQHVSGVKKSAFEGRIRFVLESPWRFAAALSADDDD